MSKIVKFTSVLAFVFAASSVFAGFEAGKGVANDRAKGDDDRDVTFVVRGGGNGYGYRQYGVPIGATFLPWAFPNFESSVYGVRFNFGWGRYEGTWGLDAGTFSRSGDFGGIAANFCGNWVERSATGIQVGLVNRGETVRGLQLGAVNLAGSLSGVQIGFLNFNCRGITLPVINVGW